MCFYLKGLFVLTADGAVVCLAFLSLSVEPTCIIGTCGMFLLVSVQVCIEI